MHLAGANSQLDADQRPALTVVVPAYNESARLPRSLEEIDRFIADSCINAEVLVVDDGSSDGTYQIAAAHQSAAARYRVLSLPHRGKASAVRAGMLAATGRYVLFTDADLSTPITYAADLMHALDDGADVAIGSREGLGATQSASLATAISWAACSMQSFESSPFLASTTRNVASRRFDGTQLKPSFHELSSTLELNPFADRE